MPAREFALIGYETFFPPNLPSSLFGHSYQERWSPRLTGGVFPQLSTLLPSKMSLHTHPGYLTQARCMRYLRASQSPW